MNTPRTTQIIIVACTALLWCSVSQAQKMYRWVDANGKVHYSDHVPSNAVEGARDEMNQKGMVVKRVQRKMSSDELAAYKEAKEAERKKRKKEEHDRKKDKFLVSSFPDEQTLLKSYEGEIEQEKLSIESAQASVKIQLMNLSQQLQFASRKERAGSEVDKQTMAKIDKAYQSSLASQRLVKKSLQQKAEKDVERERTLQRYRELKKQQ